MPKRRKAVSEEELAGYVADLQLEQARYLRKISGEVGCIMWLLLGLVFGPIILIILASLLGLSPLLLGLLGAS